MLNILDHSFYFINELLPVCELTISKTKARLSKCKFRIKHIQWGQAMNIPLCICISFLLSSIYWGSSLVPRLSPHAKRRKAGRGLGTRLLGEQAHKFWVRERTRVLTLPDVNSNYRILTICLTIALSSTIMGLQSWQLQMWHYDVITDKVLYLILVSPCGH